MPNITKQEVQKKSPMTEDWQPNDYCMKEIIKRGYDKEFIDECLTLFKAYWLERPNEARFWGTKFLEFTFRQKKYTENIRRNLTKTNLSNKSTLANDLTNIDW